MEMKSQHPAQRGQANSTDHDRDGRDRWLRIAVAVLGVFLSGLFVLLFSDTFEHGMAVAIFFTTSAWVPAMYSLALLLQPWSKDELGRDRSPATAVTAEGRWYRFGVLGNLVILLVVVGLVPAGVVHLASDRLLEPLTIGVQLLVIGLLALLDHYTRQRRSPEPGPRT